MYKDIEELLTFLNSCNIDASLKSHLENDYLSATRYVEDYYNKKSHALSNEGKLALGGLHELYKWIWSVKNCPEFKILIPHLEMLSQSATRINSEVPMINPVTGKQDDKSNKLIETLLAMFAVRYGKNIDVDDPIISSNGKNPDIIFTYNDNRIAFACKTLRGKSTKTLLDNINSASKQISRAQCDYGYVAINMMNIVPHTKISNQIFACKEEPHKLLNEFIQELYSSLLKESSEEITQILKAKQIRPIILNFMHSNTNIASSIGSISTMLKITCASPLSSTAKFDKDIFLFNEINSFIHNLSQQPNQYYTDKL